MGRGQTTLFVITGIVSLIIIIFLLNLNSSKEKQDLKSNNEEILESRATQINAIVEQCMELAAEKGVFEKLAMHGGYIETEYNETYGQYEKIDSFAFIRENVPYWYDEGKMNIPTIEKIEQNLGKYVLVEAEKCMDFSDIEKTGVKITKPVYDYIRNHFDFSDSGIKINVSMNYEDVSVKLEYPIKLEVDKKSKIISEFSAKIPVNFLRDYETGMLVLEDSLKEQPEWFDIGYNCTRYTNNGLTNIYYKNNRIMQVFDYETFYSKYKKTLRFQFAVNGINAIGFCPVVE